MDSRFANIIKLAGRVAAPQWLGLLAKGFTSNKEQAAATGLSEPRLSEIRNGTGRSPTFEEKVQICKVADISLGEWEDTAFEISKAAQSSPDVISSHYGGSEVVALGAQIAKRAALATGASPREAEALAGRFVRYARDRAGRTDLPANAPTAMLTKAAGDLGQREPQTVTRGEVRGLLKAIEEKALSLEGGAEQVQLAMSALTLRRRFGL